MGQRSGWDGLLGSGESVHGSSDPADRDLLLKQVLADATISPSELLTCASHWLTRALGAGVVSGSVLLELAYYAAEPDLLGLMRLIAALDPEQRAQVHALAQAMHAEGGPAVS